MGTKFYYRAWYRDNHDELTGTPLGAHDQVNARIEAEYLEKVNGGLLLIESRPDTPFVLYSDHYAIQNDKVPHRCELCVYATTCWQYPVRSANRKPCDIFTIYK